MPNVRIRRWCAVLVMAATPLLAVAPASAATHAPHAPATCKEVYRNTIQKGGDGYYQIKILTACENVGVQAEVKCKPVRAGKDHDFYSPVIYYKGQRTRASCKQSASLAEAWSIVAKIRHEIWPVNTTVHLPVVLDAYQVPAKSCWKIRATVAAGTNGFVNISGICDSGHWWYRARAKCYASGGRWHYTYGVWRDSTKHPSVATCSGTYNNLTKAWWQRYKDGHYIQVYP